jgi:hypothetical protein
MLRNTLTDIACVVDGKSLSNAFEVGVASAKTVSALKKLIKVEQTPAFDDITVNQLTLRHVSIPNDKQALSFRLMLSTTRQD